MAGNNANFARIMRESAAAEAERLAAEEEAQVAALLARTAANRNAAIAAKLESNTAAALAGSNTEAADIVVHDIEVLMRGGMKEINRRFLLRAAAVDDIQSNLKIFCQII